jgi:hypothetical protein
MNTSVSIQKILKKPPLLVVIPIIYFFIVLLLKWHLALPWSALFFFLGGIVGVFLLDIAEEIFQVSPSPFRTTGFVIGLAIVGFYVVSSTREYAAIGVVLSVLFTLLLFQISEWRIRKNLDSWYKMFFGNVSIDVQKMGMVALGVVFLVETVMFILG